MLSGYPVVNDPLYNHTVFGPQKGKGGVFGKSDEELITDLINIHNAEKWLGIDGDIDLSMFKSVIKNEYLDYDGRSLCLKGKLRVFISETLRVILPNRKRNGPNIECTRMFRQLPTHSRWLSKMKGYRRIFNFFTEYLREIGRILVYSYTRIGTRMYVCTCMYSICVL